MTTQNKPSFEEGLSALEDLVKKVESGQLSLSESLAAYEQGMKLYAQLSEMLDLSEKQLQTLALPSINQEEA